MSRAQLIEMAKANIAQVKAGTIPQEPGLYRVPASNYYAPERWALAWRGRKHEC